LIRDVPRNINEMEALKHCGDWRDDRRWLRANKVDVSEYPEEKKFQEYCKKFSFKKRAKAIEIISA